MRKAIETNNGLKGGLLKGKAHYDSNGNPLGGIKAIVTDQGGKPIEVEGNEVIINKKTVQSDKILTVKGTPKEILSTLNQMDGNGVAIGDEEAEILAKYRTGGELITYKNKYNKKYGYSINESHDLEEISNDTGISIKGLQEIYNKGIGAYKTNPTSVRPNVKSKEQWAMARVYSAVMGGKASIVDKKELNIRFKTGGSIKPNLSKMTPSELKEFYASPEGKKLDAQTYAEWKRLVNMTKSELEKFYNSVEGKKAGLSSSEANRQGIDSGRESARWIMKMKDIPYKEWSSDMWRWAKKQINFIKRMSGMKGRLYDEKGNKTRKHTALLIWGHNPKQKFRGGGELSQKALAVETNDLTDFVRKYFIKDGRIDVSDAMQELFGNKGGKSIADEYRKRIGLHKKGGLTISQLAHKLWEEHRDEVREGIDDSDFRNAIEEVLISEYGVSSMINSLIEKSSESEEDKENEYWMRRYGEDEDYYDDYYEDLTDEEVADYFKDMEGFEKELAKGTEHEMEHLATLKKVAEHKITPEEGVVETASKHLEENPQYYEDLAKMELEALKDKLKNQGYNVTIPSGGNRISVIGYGKGYFNAKKQKADSILSSLKRNGYNAVSKLDADGYYDFWVYADEPKQDLAKMESENKETYTYALTLRPFDIGTYPKENFIRVVEEESDNYKFGLLEYSKPLNDSVIQHYGLAPVSELLKYDGVTFDYFEGNLGKANIKRTEGNIPYVDVDLYDKDTNELVETYDISGEEFLRNIGKDWKIVDGINPSEEESIPDLIEGLKVLAESLEGGEKKEIEDVIEGLEILLESEDKFEKGGELDNNSMFFEMSKAEQQEEKRIMENQFGKNI